MSERWVPLLAAVVGLLGGMGGAYIGGSVANEGQQQRFENEQIARLQDLRRVAYAGFVEEAANVEFSRTRSSVDKLLGAEAQAELYADYDVRNAARAVSDAVRQMGDCDPDVKDCYGLAVGQFLDAAKAQLEAEE